MRPQAASMRPARRCHRGQRRRSSLERLRAAFEGARSGQRQVYFVTVLIDALRASGHEARARALTGTIIAFARSRGELVFLPELLRLRGEQSESTGPAAALADYREAVSLARASGARSLEARAAESLAALEGELPVSHEGARQ